MKILFSLFLLLTFFSLNAFAVQLGDPEKFAARFDDRTGNLTEILYKSELLTIPGGGDQRFDIQVSGGQAAGLNEPRGFLIIFRYTPLPILPFCVKIPRAALISARRFETRCRF